MRSKHGNLKRAERKIRQFQGRQWVGYLTPSEALAILDDGASEPHQHHTWREYLQKEKDKGSSAPQWFYFIPSKAQQERWSR